MLGDRREAAVEVVALTGRTKARTCSLNNTPMSVLTLALPGVESRYQWRESGVHLRAVPMVTHAHCASITASTKQACSQSLGTVESSTQRQLLTGFKQWILLVNLFGFKD